MEWLSEVNPNLPVILQKDAEGNGYSPLSGMDDEGYYQEDSPWSGYVCYLEDYDDEIEREDAREAYPPVVTLWPVN